MWLCAGYFDESVDEDIEDRCFTIAGFIGPQYPAILLDFQWGDNLKKWNLDYFKASEIELGFGQFAQYRDDPKNLKAPLSTREKSLIREIKTSFVDIICDNCSEDGLSGVGATLVLRDLHLLREQEPGLAKRLPRPYSLCGDLMLLEAGQIMLLSNHNSSRECQGEMRPIFDIQQEYGPRFRDAFPSFAQKNPNCSKFLLPPIFEKEQDYRCLQAADLLAYESRKLLVNSLYDPDRPERIAMTRLKEHVDRIYLLDYESLKLIAESQTVDAIPIKPTINNSKDSHSR